MGAVGGCEDGKIVKMWNLRAIICKKLKCVCVCFH